MKKIKPKLSPHEEKLLKLKVLMKRRKPFFTRMNSWYLDRLDEDVWRKPRGLDNKIRLERKGYPPKVKIGYRTPREVRYRHPSGFIERIVYNVKDLQNINPSKEAIRIASTVGKRKRELILEEANKLGIKVLNP